MHDLLIGLYLANAVLLIDHEIDSAYWKEWDLFGIPGGITVFLLMHIPLLGVVLYGLVLIVRNAAPGAFFSFALCFGGIFAFSIHTYFLKKGRPEFNKPVSKLILAATLVVSIVQAVVTVLDMNS